MAGLTIIPGSAGAIMLGDATLTVNQADTTQFNGVISGEGGLTKTGAGLLSLTGASTYTGATTVDAGTLRLDPRGSLASTSALIVDGGIFDLENGGQTVGSLSGTGGAITLGNGSLTVDQATNTSFAGSIGGAGALTLAGGGTLALGNAGNSYAGGTSVIQNSTVSIASRWRSGRDPPAVSPWATPPQRARWRRRPTSPSRGPSPWRPVVAASMWRAARRRPSPASSAAPAG